MWEGSGDLPAVVNAAKRHYLKQAMWQLPKMLRTSISVKKPLAYFPGALTHFNGQAVLFRARLTNTRAPD
jgi:hypothetical protein